MHNTADIRSTDFITGILAFGTFTRCSAGRCSHAVICAGFLSPSYPYVVKHIHIRHVFIRRPEPQQQQDLLEQALAEEMAKAQRRSGQDVAKASQVQFKQVQSMNRCHAPVAGTDLPVAAVLMLFGGCMSCSKSCRQLHKSVSDRAEFVQHAPC